jgi:glutaredoxin 3
MRDIKVYTTRICGYCQAAKRLLDQLGLPFEEIGLDDKPELRQKISEENGHYRTVPMIFIDGQFIGGFTDLQALHKQGKLVE